MDDEHAQDIARVITGPVDTSVALSADGNVAIGGGLARMVWAAHRCLPAVARSAQGETLVLHGGSYVVVPGPNHVRDQGQAS
jgi:hypothetical protein